MNALKATVPSKFLDEDDIDYRRNKFASEAIAEGKALREMISGRRILEDQRDLMNAFRL